MVLKAPRCVLLVVVCLTFLVFLETVSGATYRQFKQRHIDNGQPPSNARTYWNQMMQRRGMTHPVCKPTNTFIHSSDRQVRGICGAGGRPVFGNTYQSRHPFRITTCRVIPGSRPPRCNYRGHTVTRNIRVSCVRRLPVYFAGIV
ncbi:ribonuclease-like [Hemicordylus capensis]|uniref:ribonuclease-like n=1 Tax=Hemicordylus capensis TaxID=884348 RepID=UPI002304648E|nr:ribonuclease-like [Hemicordylus capensis]